ncbi:MAG: hypothetical protein KGL10_00405, partial [Alphaproteobacteria bacterium]|nr:hypothetical protein [Alphaproteobacteria bacterium]
QTVPMATAASGGGASTGQWQTAANTAFQRTVNTGGNNIGVEIGNGGGGDGGGGTQGGFMSFMSHVPVLGSVFGGVAAIAKLVNIFVGIVKGIAQVMTSPVTFIAKAINGGLHGDILDMVAPDMQDNTVYPLSVLINLGHKLIEIGVGLHLDLLGVVLALSLIPMDDVASAVSSSTLMTLLGIIATIFLSCGATLSFWLPALPLIRVAFAVLTWAVAVFEAVALLPIAALSFLSTTGEGWDAKHVFLNWLDVFTRPVLTVVGFVGSLLVFNTFFSYFFTIFKAYMHTQLVNQSGLSGIVLGLLSMLADTVIFFIVIYSAANTCFKMISTVPDAFFRWAPIGGSRAGFSDDGGDHSGAVGKLGGMTGESMEKGRSADTKLASGGAKWAGGKIKGMLGGGTSGASGNP